MGFRDEYYLRCLLAHGAAYLFLQAFMIPGTVFVNLSACRCYAATTLPSLSFTGSNTISNPHPLATEPPFPRHSLLIFCLAGYLAAHLFVHPPADPSTNRRPHCMLALASFSGPPNPLMAYHRSWWRHVWNTHRVPLGSGLQHRRVYISLLHQQSTLCEAVSCSVGGYLCIIMWI